MPTIKPLVRKIIGAVIWLLLIGMLGLMYYSCQWLADISCRNDIHKEYLSPDGKLKAVVFQRHCGATTGYSTQISIIPALDSLRNEMGNVFMVDGYSREVAPNLEWVDDRRIKIFRKLTGKEYAAQTHYGWIYRINIDYQ